LDLRKDEVFSIREKFYFSAQTIGREEKKMLKGKERRTAAGVGHVHDTSGQGNPIFHNQEFQNTDLQRRTISEERGKRQIGQKKRVQGFPLCIIHEQGKKKKDKTQEGRTYEETKGPPSPG